MLFVSFFFNSGVTFAFKFLFFPTLPSPLLAVHELSLILKTLRQVKPGKSQISAALTCTVVVRMLATDFLTYKTQLPTRFRRWHVYGLCLRDAASRRLPEEH